MFGDKTRRKRPSAVRHGRRFGLLAIWLALASTTPSQAQLPTRWLHSAIYDAARQRMVVFGGTPDSQTLEGDTWQLALGLDPIWSPLTTGPGPSGRLGHSAIYDPVRDRMLVFGGLDAGSFALGDVWALSLADGSWAALAPNGSPPLPRRYHTAIYDPVRDRMVVFGGSDASGNRLSDVWSLWLSPSPRWERLFPNGAPPTPRYSHSAVYDAARDRMLVFGGGIPASNDLWELTFADTTWRLLAPASAAPPERFGHTAIYDPVGDRMVVFGGNGTQYLDDVWLLSLGGAQPAWSRFQGTSPWPSSREYHSAVYDSAQRRVVAFGGYPDVLEPTWALALDPPMRWSPERPLIEPSPATLDLPAVTVGDTVSAPFAVTNGGMRRLQIESLEPSRPDLRVEGPPSASLPWNASLHDTLSLAAATPGVSDDSLVIVSDDPVTPRARVGVHLDVRALSFATRVLGDPDSVPPGVSFIVVVTPDPGVRVEGGKLFYRISGASLYDSLALTPLATDFIGAIPASAVTERGVEYFVRVENSGFAAFRPADAPASWITQKVAAPTAILAVIPRPTSGSDFLAGQPIEVDVELPDGAVVESGALEVRGGGEPQFQSLLLAPTGISGQLAAVIPDSLVGPRGLEYRATVTTLLSTLSYPAAGSDPAAIRVRVPGLTEPSFHPARRYRLLSVPLDFGADFAGSLDALLVDDLGAYDPTRWRAFVYDPASQANLEFSSQQAARFRPEPGRAFWLISRDDHHLDTQPIAGFSTSTATPYAIPVAAGWNLMANPFDFPVAWAEVGGDTAYTGDPVAFDSWLGAIGDYADVTPILMTPFEGYWIHATRQGTLLIPPHAAPTPIREARIPAATAASEQEWRVRLVARSETADDGANLIGFSPEASPGYDRLDLLKPPVPPGSWVRLGMPHLDWGERAGEYRHDLRPSGGEGQTWELELRSAQAGEVVRLDLTELALARPGWEVELIDREQGAVVPWPTAGGEARLRAPLEHEVVSFGARPYRIAVAVGTEEYLRGASGSAPGTPADLALDPAAPNPFQIATRIRFGLPRAGRASLQIYGLRGERVASLLGSAPLAPGFHALPWDGRSDDGRLLPAGIYWMRLELGGESRTQRLVVLR